MGFSRLDRVARHRLLSAETATAGLSRLLSQHLLADLTLFLEGSGFGLQLALDGLILDLKRLAYVSLGLIVGKLHGAVVGGKRLGRTGHSRLGRTHSLDVRGRFGLVFIDEHGRQLVGGGGFGFCKINVKFFLFLLNKFFLFVNLFFVLLDAGEKDLFGDDLGHLFGAGFLHELGSPVLGLGDGILFFFLDRFEVVVTLGLDFFVGPAVDLLLGDHLRKLFLILFFFDFSDIRKSRKITCNLWFR